MYSFLLVEHLAQEEDSTIGYRYVAGVGNDDEAEYCRAIPSELPMG